MSADLDIASDLARFTHDPLGFVIWAFPWGEPGTVLADEKGLRAWQRKLLTELGEALRSGASLREALPICIARASGHGIGKSAIVAWLILWALMTREYTRGVVTANTENQLRTKTWPEVAKWHSLAICGDWFTCAATSIHATGSDEKKWRIDAVPWSEHNTEAFAGLHNKGGRILALFDEASAIADKVWEVMDGALTDENTEIVVGVFGNPTRNAGRFRECFRRNASRWNHEQIDSRTVEGVNRAFLDQLVAENGEDSDLVKVRVRGMFPSSSFKQFIASEDVDAAFGRHIDASQFRYAPKIITVDPAWSGDDPLVIAIRQGLAFRVLRVIPKNDNDVQIANIVAQYEDEEQADGVIVDGGYGTGIVSAGRTMGRKWLIAWFGEKSPDAGCLNLRAHMWNQMKKWLKEGGAIPADHGLRDELTGPETVPRMDGKIQLESKEQMKLRGLPSPNKADALALSFAYPIQARSGPGARSPTGQCVTDFDPYAAR
jgi:hypothetical protein